jgi:secondary thiamine-phosphate synthase enzyme
MKSYRKELWFKVPGRRAFINITPQVEECLRESGVMEGLALVNAMHITASVFINDDESGLQHDYETWLEQIAPHEPVSHYHHNEPAKTTPTPTSSAKSWAVKWSSQSHVVS